ncbi:MAG: hypothetical protein LBG91_05255 [Treponema sp.]|nr:hypothetical protein [Treponema sp.]
MQSDLENPLAKQIIAGTIREGDTVTADTAPDRKTTDNADVLTFRKSG